MLELMKFCTCTSSHAPQRLGDRDFARGTYRRYGRIRYHPSWRRRSRTTERAHRLFVCICLSALVGKGKKPPGGLKHLQTRQTRSDMSRAMENSHELRAFSA